MKIKVVTLNIEHGGVQWTPMVEFLQTENADILLLQEVYNEHDTTLETRFQTIDELKKKLQYTGYDFALEMLSVHDFGKVERGIAIFSKLPITQRYDPIFFNEPFNDNYVDTVKNAPNVPRNLQHVTLDAQGTVLDIFNFQGVWDLDGTHDSPKRLRMSQVIVSAVQGLPNVVLAGDTNAQRNCQSIRNIEAYLNSVFGDKLPTTFNVQQKDLKKYPGYATAAVDMMFTSPNLKVLEHYCAQVNISDHLPLVAVIEVPES